MPTTRFWKAFALSVAVYLLATAFAGRDVLQHLGTTAVHDAGDPLLTAAILHWTTTHLPLTDAWWQLPIFYPTRDALTFSEHLLGLSVMATPIEWVTRDPLVAYNLVTLLTTPLCGAAMYLLVWWLTGSGAAAFLGGLAFAFAPYRAAQLPHVQMLALFWAPLALLGLHAFLDTRRRRWLALYGGAWLLQSLANGYTLFFFSLLIAIWVLWFVIARGQWRALGGIIVATVVAALPLVPILYRYLVVHQAHAFTRSVTEMEFFSADAAGVLCASSLLTFWGSLHVLCGPEGQLFPGLAVFLLACVGGALLLTTRGTSPAMPRLLRVLWGVSLALGLAYLAIVCVVLFGGPWRFSIGSLRISASSIRKPLLIAIPALTIAGILWWRFRRAGSGLSTLSFYLTAAVLMWVLALGPEIKMMGRDTHVPGLFNLLLYLPGIDGLRVPARFWMMTVLCLATAAGLVVSHIVRAARPPIVMAVTIVAAVALLADGWVNRIPAANVGVFPVAPATLAGRLVLQLPTGEVQTDVRATYEAVVGGWRSVNGYSGYEPNYQNAVVLAMREEEDALFEPFRALDDLDVTVRPWDPRLVSLVERQPGVRLISSSSMERHYRLARRGRPGDGRSAGRRIPVATTSSSCAPDDLRLFRDGNRQTGWTCYSDGAPQTLDIDLGSPADVGAVVMALGDHYDAYPRTLEVTTSVDGRSWTAAWDGSLLAQTIRGGMEDPRSLRLTVPFAPRPARYIRLHHPAARAPYYWFISELEVWSGNTGVPES